MKRWLITCGLATVIGLSGWLLYNKDAIHCPGDVATLLRQQWQSWFAGESSATGGKDSLRIASFNVQVFGPAKASRPDIMAAIAKIVAEFDVVALQELRSDDDSIAQRLVDLVNQTGRRYAYVASRPVGRNVNLERYIVIYDQDVVQLDGAQAYLVEDPDDVLRREPLVTWFRTRGVPPDQAFTFSLVNVHLDAASPEQEVAYLANLFRAVRNDGRYEDDVIIAGDFNVGDEELEPVRAASGLTWIIRQTPTNTRATAQYDNIILDGRATTEFSGRSGVFDFLRQFNLTLPDALAISDHLPVWAEFHCREDSAVDGSASINSSHQTNL
jgi:endonuclease/exonuclease/phosphatase family metal-dependent hydrolase